MQSNKASKKTSPKATEITTAPVAAAPTEKAATTRPVRSSQSKSESSESSSAKRHRKAVQTVAEEVKPATEVASEPVTTVPTPAPKIAIVAQSETQPYSVAAVEPSFEQIAALAHALWMQRGCEHGCPEEDWFKAEEHLKTTAAGA